MNLFWQVSLWRPCLTEFLRYALAGSLAACCSCSYHSSLAEDPLVPLGYMSGDMDMGSEHRELVDVLELIASSSPTTDRRWSKSTSIEANSIAP